MHRVGLQGVALTGGASGGDVAGGASGGIGPGTGFGLSGPGVGLCAGGTGRGLGATCGGEGRGGVSSPAAHGSSTGMGSQSGHCAELLDCLEPPRAPGRGEMVGSGLAPGLSGSLDRLVGSRACRAFAGGGSAVAIFDSSGGTGTEPGFPCAREGVEGARGGVAASAWHGTAPLLEYTYVDPSRAGTCYRAAGWRRCAGCTSGRPPGGCRTSPKAVWVHPLSRHWRRGLCAESGARLPR